MSSASCKVIGVFLVMLGVCLVPAWAEDIDGRFVQLQADQIKVKESKATDISYRIEAMRAGLEEERRELKLSNERLWQEYAQSAEMERREMNERLKHIDDKQKLFEAEFNKKQQQDELRVREKEMELKRMMLEFERLKAEIQDDNRVLNETKLEMMDEQKKKEQAGVRDGGAIGGEVLENQSVKITGFQGKEVMGQTAIKRKKVIDEYYVAMGDILSIEVWRVPDMTRKIAVRPDGRISLPLAGDLPVVGLSLVEIRELITEKLKDYIKNPQVTITVDKFGGRKFIILGRIKSPGVYRFDSEISLIESIALAGGFNDDARSGKIMIIRGDIHKQPQVKMISASVENILKRGMLSENLTVLPNDIIYVGKDFLGDYREVLTQVIEPTFDNLVDFFVLRSAIRQAQDKPR